MEFNATFIIVAISFIVFVFIMNTILYHPLEHIVEEREKLISDNYKNADTLNSEAKTMLEKKAHEIAKAKVDAKNSIDEQLKKEYDKSAEQIQAAKEESINNIKEQKQMFHQQSEEFQKDIDSDIESYAKLIADKLLNGNEAKNG